MLASLVHASRAGLREVDDYTYVYIRLVCLAGRKCIDHHLGTGPKEGAGLRGIDQIFQSA